MSVLTDLKEELLEFLDAHQVADDVVRSGVEVNFIGTMEGAELDFQYDDIENSWLRVIDLLSKLIVGDKNGKSENTDGIIAKIEADGVQLKQVVTVLGFAMEKLKDKTLESTAVSLLAARMYLLLCCLDSSHIFGVFFKSMLDRAFYAFKTANLKKIAQDEVSKPSKTTKLTKHTVIEPSNVSETQLEAFNSEILSDSLFAALEQLYLFLKHDVCRNYIGEIADFLQSVSRFNYSSLTSVLPAENLEAFKKITSFSSRSFALAHLCLSENINREDVVLAKFCLPRLIFKNFDGQFLRGVLPQGFIKNANVMVEFLKLKFAGKDDSETIFMKRLAENVIHYCLADRMDHRLACINVALQLIQDLSQPLVHQFFYFVVNYSFLTGRSPKLMAVDLICTIFDRFDLDEFPIGLTFINKVDYELFAIYQALEFNNEDFNKKCPGATKHWKKFGSFAGDNKFNVKDEMMKVLVRATMDKVSAVRGRALNAILRFVKTPEGYQELTRHAKLFIIDKRSKIVKVLSEVNVHDERNDGRETQMGTQRTETPIPSQIQEGAQQEAGFLKNVSAAPFIDLIIQRCNDKSCVTRKFVIPIIEALLDLEKNISYQKLLLEKLQDFCRDPTLAVRKLGAEAMTRVVRDERVYKKAWLHTVLPMMNDRDDSVEKTCRKMFFDKIVHPIVENKGTDSLSWNLVIEIAKSSSFKRALRTCFRSVAKDAENKSLLNKLAKVLYGSVKVDAVAKPAWMLLDYLADELDIDVLIAVHAWIASDKSVKDVDPAVRITTDPLELLSILSVILKKHNSLKEEDKVAFRNNLALRIAACELPPPVISDAIIAFAGVFNGPEFRIWGELVNECYRGLLTATEDEKAEKSMSKRRHVLGKRILTLGQSAMHSPESITDDIVDLLIHILSAEAPLLDEKQVEAMSRPATRMNQGSQQPQEVYSKVQGLPFSQLTTEIIAAAVIALGKIILIREDIAQECLNKLVLVLGSSQHAGVRNNVIYILGDCYLKYTNQMDPLQKAFLHGLRDRVDFVRYHTLLLTTELLRSQYMKLSALVIARLLPLLMDKDATIRNTLEKETLAVIEEQFPTVYTDNYVTVMFLINRVPYGVYNDIKNLEMPYNPICFLNHNFSGPLKRNERMTIYKFMLKKFDDQQRFNLINNICRTIFGSVVEEKINFETPEVKQLIVDGLQVIQLPEAKLQFDEGSKDDDDEADLPPEELQKMAKKTIKMAFCQAFVQVIMPQFMAMSRYLAKKRSMLQKEFRNCLAVIAESYPDELHLLFQDNAQLKLEVEADLKQKKRDERKSRVEKNRRLVQDIQEAPIPEIEQNNEKENEELPMVEVVIGEDEQVAVKEEQLTQIITAQEKSRHEEEIAEGIENIVITPQNDENVAEENEQANVEVENNQENEETSEEQESEDEKNDEEADKENERIEENAKDDEVFEEDEQNDKQEKSLTVVPETPEQTLVEELDRSNLRTAIETTKNKTFSVFSDSSVSSVDTPSTPVGPPKKRRKSEVSIHLLQSLRKSNPVLLTRTPYLDADVPILSPRVTGFNKTSKRIHSTPKSSAGGSMDFTFGPDFSMIAPADADQPKFAPGTKRPRE